MTCHQQQIFSLLSCNRAELPAASKLRRMLGPSTRSSWRYVCANERVARIFNLSAGVQDRGVIIPVRDENIILWGLSFM